MPPHKCLSLDGVRVCRLVDTGSGDVDTDRLPPLRCEPAHGGGRCRAVVRDGRLALCPRDDPTADRPLATFECGRVSALALGAAAVALRCEGHPHTDNVLLQCAAPADAAALVDALGSGAGSGSGSASAAPSAGRRSVFDSRTDESSASQYFQFYGYLSQQQNMMQDYIRTSTYQRAMLSNLADFADKVVLDVGAGSGILSFFAVQAGARKVYAVEASNMALYCQKLIRSNGMTERIVVVAGKIEEVELPEKVDTVISEPMGYMLLNERMLETYLHAKKFLKPGGAMFPSRGDLHVAPFSDESLFIEQSNKSNFWCQSAFHGVDLSSLRPHAVDECMKQPVVDTWHPAILLAKSQMWSVDFRTAKEADLYDIEIPLRFEITSTAFVHGLAFWFDVAFIGGSETVWLSTSPSEPLTHWYQVRCLVDKPVLCQAGAVLTGTVHMLANTRQSYDVHVSLSYGGAEARASLDLKNPCFRYTGAPVLPPAGHSVGEQSPSELAQQQQAHVHQQHNYWQPAAGMATAGVTAGPAIQLSNGCVTDAAADAKTARMAPPHMQPLAYQPHAMHSNPAVYTAFANAPMHSGGVSASGAAPSAQPHVLGVPVVSAALGGAGVAFAAPSTISN